MSDQKQVVTVMQLDKDCKSCKRFRSIASDEKVSTGIYIMNDAHAALGSPSTVEIFVKSYNPNPVAKPAPANGGKAKKS